MSGSSYLQAAAEAARITSAVALGYYKRDPEQMVKADGTPVSIADLEAEKTARAWIEKRFPEDGIVGEEFPTVREGAKRRWIVDPIDGTYTFLRGVPFWGTIVAVAEGDDVIAGAVCCSAINEEISAAPGEGCWFNGSRCSVSSQTELAKATLLTTDARFLRDESRRARWLTLQNAAGGMRTWGDCYGYILVATGRADIMVDDAVSAWDAAALMPIITEAGGTLTDWKGNATPFGGDAIATNGKLSEQVLAIMSGRKQ
ncbi:MAG: histidinol phosphate phosphatase [Gemmatimonadota bacterium]|nr:histidinol phosphate phosphatase [Gemmatimonadota bacterium]